MSNDVLDRFHLTVPAAGPPSAVTWINVQDYGALGDRVTDDGGAIALAYAAIVAQGGGTLFFPGPATYRTTLRLNITSSHVTIEGNGATILFDPTVPATNDRAFAIYGGLSTLRPITGAIASGATSFTAASAASTADLLAGDWLTLTELGDGVNPYFVDWVQVASVAGTTVTVLVPFRTAFPGTHATVQFRRVTSLVTHVTVRDLLIRMTSTPATFVTGLTVGQAARTVTIEHCDFQTRHGSGLTTFLAADVTIAHCVLGTYGGTPEFASTVDLVVNGCTFGTPGATPANLNAAAAEIDFGTACFAFTNNRLLVASNIGLEIVYGCHDGSVAGNVVSWVTDVGVGVGLGMFATGCQRIAYVGNVLVGGTTGTGNTGINSTTDSVASPPMASVGNVIVGNTIANFTHPIPLIPEAGDYYLQHGENASAGALTLSNGLERVYTDDGTAAAPAQTFKTQPDTGFARLFGGGYLGVSAGGVNNWAFGPTGHYYQSAIADVLWTTGATNGTVDLRLRRSAAKTFTIDDGAGGAVTCNIVGTPAVSGTPGIDTTITSAGLVGKTITVTKGLITGFT